MHKLTILDIHDMQSPVWIIIQFTVSVGGLI